MAEERESFDYDVEDDKEEYSDELDEDSSSDVCSSPDLKTTATGRSLRHLEGDVAIMEDEKEFDIDPSERWEVDRLFEKGDRFGSARGKEECEKVLLKIGDQGRHLLLEPTDFDNYWNAFKGHVEKMFDAKSVSGTSRRPPASPQKKYSVTFHEKKAITGYPSLSWDPTAVSFKRIAYFSLEVLGTEHEGFAIKNGGGNGKKDDHLSPLKNDDRWLFGLKASGYPHVLVKRVEFFVKTIDTVFEENVNEGFKIVKDESPLDKKDENDDNESGGKKVIIEVKKKYYPEDDDEKGEEITGSRIDFRDSERIGLYRVVYKYSGTPIAPVYWNVLPRAQLLNWKKEDEKKMKFLKKETRDASKRLNEALKNTTSLSHPPPPPPELVIPDSNLDQKDVDMFVCEPEPKDSGKKRRRSVAGFKSEKDDDENDLFDARSNENVLFEPISPSFFQDRPPPRVHGENDVEILNTLETFMEETIGSNNLRWIHERDGGDDNLVGDGKKEMDPTRWLGLVPDWDFEQWKTLFGLKIEDVVLRLTPNEEIRDVVFSDRWMTCDDLKTMHAENCAFDTKFQTAVNFRDTFCIDPASFPPETWTTLYYEAFDHLVYLHKMIRRHFQDITTTTEHVH